MMYKTEDAFVKGQKIKLIITVVIILIVIVHSCATHTPVFK